MSNATDINIGPMIADSARLGLGYAERLLKGITPDRFARLADCGDRLIESNHPAFVLGHLSLYPCRIVEQLGGDAAAIVPSEAFVKVFDPKARCVDDADGTVYPSMDEITERFFAAHRLAIETLQTAADRRFHEANPNEAMRGKFATIGSMHGFYLGGHLMLHIGQLSAWRRMIGLPAA